MKKKEGAEKEFWQLPCCQYKEMKLCVCCLSQETVPPQTGAAVWCLLAAAPPADCGRVHGERLPAELPAAEGQDSEGGVASVHVSGRLWGDGVPGGTQFHPQRPGESLCVWFVVQLNNKSIDPKTVMMGSRSTDTTQWKYSISKSKCLAFKTLLKS